MSLGFFKSTDFKINNPAALGMGCGKCSLHRRCKSPRMKEYGKGKKGILFLGEAPGKNEDERGLPLVGKSGQLLLKYCRKYGLDPEEDIVKLNAVACRPPDGRDATDLEVEYCRGRVWSTIEKYKPKVIIPLGMTAMQSILGHRWHVDTKEGGLGSMSRWRGWLIPDRETKCWVAPCNHPAYVLRMEGNSAVEQVFSQDLQQAIYAAKKPVPKWENERDCVEILMEEPKIVKYLQSILKSKKATISIDYETTGLKPYREGHRIWYIGIADTPDHAVCFPTAGNKEALRLYRKICMNPSIKKIAHNLMFEDLWSRERLGVQINGWKMCTMQTAHVLDYRPGVTGLKFQAYVRMGLVDYSSHISPYLQCTEKEDEMYGSNGFNSIHKAPVKETMIYCGIDCITTYRLAQIQERELNNM